MGLRSRPSEARSSPPPRPLLFFTPHEARTVEALMGRVMPDDDLGPGAVEAGTVSYADQTLADVEQANQRIYRSGVRLLDAASETRFGRAFADCGPEDQDAIVADMAAGSLAAEAPASEDPGWSLAFFELLREHTLEGMFGDPVHGGNRDLAGWKLLGYPGPPTGLQPRGAATGCGGDSRADVHGRRLPPSAGWRTRMSATTDRADVCVVGLGPAGATAAYGLTAAGMRVVALDAGPRRNKDEYRRDEYRIRVRTGTHGSEVQHGAPDVAAIQHQPDAARDVFAGQDEQRRRRHHRVLRLAEALRTGRLSRPQRHHRPVR